MNVKMVFVFVASAVLIFGGLIYGAAVRQGWFQPTNKYIAKFDRGDGVFAGTVVTITGLRAGAVKQVELNDKNEVIVTMEIQKKFATHIREDSVAEMGRHFVIGERYIAILAGSKDKALLAPGSELEGKVNLEITDLMGGKVLGKYLELFHKLMDQLATVITGEDGNKDLLTVYKQAYRALVSVEKMGNVIGDKSTGHLVRELSRNAENLTALIATMQETMPQMNSLVGNIDKMTPKLNRTLEETTFTLRALQKSFILRGASEDLREEMAKEEKERKKRMPASEDGVIVD